MEIIRQYLISIEREEEELKILSEFLFVPD